MILRSGPAKSGLNREVVGNHEVQIQCTEIFGTLNKWC